MNGKILEGFGHPEMGHLLVRLHPEDTYQGSCPYHESCLEGLAAGPAIEGRYNKKGHELENEDKVWEMQAYYLAQALVDYTLILRPDRIIMGGGVMKQKKLFPLIRNEFTKLMGNYLETPDMNQYIVNPGLGDYAGVIGCLLLATEIYEKRLDNYIPN